MIPVPPFAAPVARAIDNLDALIQRGLGVDSPDIIFVKQPDGRLVPKLHPSLVPKVAGAPLPPEETDEGGEFDDIATSDLRLALLDYPRSFRVVSADFDVRNGSSATIRILWGAAGTSGASISFGGLTNIIVGPPAGENFHFVCDQVVPSLGFLKVEIVATDPISPVNMILNWSVHLILL